MRAAIGADYVGSRFERSVWSEGRYPDIRCVGYDVEEPQVDNTGEMAAAFYQR